MREGLIERLCIGGYYYPQTAPNCLVDIWLTGGLVWWVHAGDAEASLSVKPQPNSLSATPSTYIP